LLVPIQIGLDRCGLQSWLRLAYTSSVIGTHIRVLFFLGGLGGGQGLSRIRSADRSEFIKNTAGLSNKLIMLRHYHLSFRRGLCIPSGSHSLLDLRHGLRLLLNGGCGHLASICGPLSGPGCGLSRVIVHAPLKDLLRLLLVSL
jgi:hypothetical protein